MFLSKVKLSIFKLPTIFFYLAITFKVRSYSSYIKSFKLVSALNPDCSIRMNCDNGPWIFMPLGLSFAEDPRLYKTPFSGEKGLGSINSLPNFLSCIVLWGKGEGWAPPKSTRGEATRRTTTELLHARIALITS